MMNRCSAIVMACGLAASATAADKSALTSAERVFVERTGIEEFSGQMIVRPERKLHPVQDAQARQLLDGMVLKYYPEVDEYVIQVPAELASGEVGDGENRLHAQLMSSGLFQYVVPNWTVYPLAIPNDPQYGGQWHHTAMQSALGWDISTGSSTIITAYTDTGIDLTHPDLAAKRVPGFDAPNDIAEVDGGSVAELHGHGTHVAGCGAAITNNNVGVAGVNWNARIMMIRVTNNSGGGASYDDLMQGARWAAENGAKTVSASYSGVSNPPIQTTGEYIKSLGSLYMYAAGNFSENLNFEYPDVIVVGASQPGDTRAGFSGYGQAIDVFAPGTGILSSTWGGGYAAWDGTSMATPLVNGLCSVIWSINPNLTPTQVENILFASCDDMEAPGNDGITGWGRVNLYKAAQAAAGTVGPVAPTAVDDNAGNTFPGTPVVIDVLSNDSDVNNDPITILSFDATSSDGATITRSVGTGPGGRDQLVYTASSGQSGPDTFNYVITDGITGNDTGTVSVNVLNPDFFRDPENPNNPDPAIDVAWYFFTSDVLAMPNFASLTPSVSTTYPRLNQNKTVLTFMNSTKADRVGGVFTGYIDVPTTDMYEFTVEADDGAVFSIGDNVIIDHAGPHGWTQKAGSIGLKAGKHAFKVTYFENKLDAGLRLYWSSSTQVKEVIPAAAYWHGGDLSCPSDFDGSGFVDIEDYTAFVAAFEAGSDDADFDGSGFVDIEDFGAFVAAFESGC